MQNEGRKKIKEQALSQINALKEELFSLNDYLADHPELSGEEVESCEKICKLLEGHKIPVERAFNGQPTAFKGAIKSSAASKIKIGILAEYDALPGIGHACGHCASGTLSILAALALAGCEGLPDCNIDIIGTPDEEARGGKVLMADAGVFDEYSFVMMIHMGGGKRNMIYTDMLALAPFYFRFKGRPAHAAQSPWEGKNALNGATLMLHAVDMLRQHVLPTTRLHGIVAQGGTVVNVVPDAAVVDFLARSPEKYYLQDIVRKVENCARGAALATETEVEIDRYAPMYDSLLHIPAGIEVLKSIFQDLGIRDDTEASKGISGSSDVGNVSFKCPTFHARLSVCEEDIPLHTKEFADLMKTDRTKDVIVLGAEVIVEMILRTLFEPELLTQMRAEFDVLSVR